MSTSDHHTRVEDLAFLAETGENAEGAARRLGLSYNALEKWAARNMPDTWRTLTARNPRDPKQQVRRNQYSAA